MSKTKLVLDIPHWCREPKPYYATEEQARAAKQPFLDHVRAGKRPYEWEGITYTKPVRGERIRYICDFEVPNYRRDNDSGCPCPHCSPASPKYRDGRMAWFPDSKILRIIGPTCFNSIDTEEHNRAEREFLEEQRRERAIEKLRRDRGRLNSILDQMNAASDYAKELEAVRAQTIEALRLGKIDLTTHARDGLLIINQNIRHETTDGRVELLTTPLIRDASVLSFFMNDNHEYIAKLKSAIDDFRSSIEALDALDTKTAATKTMEALNRKFTSSHKRADDCIRHARAIRHGIDAPVIDTIRNWSERLDSMVGGQKIDIRRDGDQVVISARGFNRRVKIPPVVWPRLDDLPGL